MLLAEANQWPEDAVAYFGNGDECHMAFHFPIMPRLFMALHMEDRFPIIDILQQTPAIPDDLPVGALPAQPRRADARDGDRRGARLHVPRLRARRAGAHQPRHPPPPRAAARQRPPPHRADERAAVLAARARRSSTTATRSAWATTSTSATATACARRCSGAPTATPASRAPTRSGSTCRSSSTPSTTTRASTSRRSRTTCTRCCWWMKRLIALRKRYKAFGRGTIEFLHPEQPQGAGLRAPLRATRRSSSSPTCRASSQYVELDLLALARAWSPVELFGQQRRSRRSASCPYLLTLGPHAFYWFALDAPRDAGDARRAPVAAGERPCRAVVRDQRRLGDARPRGDERAGARGARSRGAAAPALVRRQGAPRVARPSPSSTRSPIPSDAWLRASR